ncbi:MAG: hypothetical protein HYZ75_18600 [Elusimicrobia bacterium]|nr:hypothetical protein [Elusimicrobiota bacterium]
MGLGILLAASLLGVGTATAGAGDSTKDPIDVFNRIIYGDIYRDLYEDEPGRPVRGLLFPKDAKRDDVAFATWVSYLRRKLVIEEEDPPKRDADQPDAVFSSLANEVGAKDYRVELYPPALRYPRARPGQRVRQEALARRRGRAVLQG